LIRSIFYPAPNRRPDFAKWPPSPAKPVRPGSSCGFKKCSLGAIPSFGAFSSRLFSWRFSPCCLISFRSPPRKNGDVGPARESSRANGLRRLAPLYSCVEPLEIIIYVYKIFCSANNRRGIDPKGRIYPSRSKFFTNRLFPVEVRRNTLKKYTPKAQDFFSMDFNGA